MPKRQQLTQLRTLAADFGNYQLKYFDGSGFPKAIRSIQYRLPNGVGGLKYKPRSPMIEVDGVRYHIGSQAWKYSAQEKTVIGNKAESARLHLYACLEQSGVYSLEVSHHSPDQYREQLTTALQGSHAFKRNGAQIEATVENVTVHPEGFGAYALAKASGYVPTTGYTVVIDIGGGSWLSSIYDSEGDLIAHNPVDRGGAYYLAVQVANDERLKAPLRQYQITAPDPGVVMDGFAMGHRYAETGIGWGDWLSDYLEPWYKGIFQTIKAQYSQHLTRVTRFIVTGGGAHLIAEKVKVNPVFVVMPDPSFANVLGMHGHAVPTLAAVAA